jgi:hypothetical protein
MFRENSSKQRSSPLALRTAPRRSDGSRAASVAGPKPPRPPNAHADFDFRTEILLLSALPSSHLVEKKGKEIPRGCSCHPAPVAATGPEQRSLKASGRRLSHAIPHFHHHLTSLCLRQHAAVLHPRRPWRWRRMGKGRRGREEGGARGKRSGVAERTRHSRRTRPQ